MNIHDIIRNTPWDTESASVEGAEIMSQPEPWVTKGLLYIVCAMSLFLLLIGIFGKTDIIISARGSVTTAKKVQNVYAPVSGEIVDIYVGEGTPVREGDVLGRIRSREAIELAAQTEKKKMEWERAKFNLETVWPKKLTLKQNGIAIKRKTIDAFKSQLLAAQQDYENSPKTTQNKHEQLKLKLAQAEKEFENHILIVREAASAVEKAQSVFDRYKHLYKIDAISKQEMEEMRNTLEARTFALKRAENTSETKKNNVTEIRLELNSFYKTMGSQLQKAEHKVREIEGKINSEELEVLEKERALDDEEQSLKQKLIIARIDYETTSKISFENIDVEQCLKLLAPSSGEVTSIACSQIGEIVNKGDLLVTIGPLGVGKVLEINIRNKDRGFVKVGQKVKVKLDAFPYQRYGIFEGILEAISPDVVSDKKLGPCYMAKVRLKSEKMFAEGESRKLTYGMLATAEIVVRKQRLSSYILDPFKSLKKGTE